MTSMRVLRLLSTPLFYGFSSVQTVPEMSMKTCGVAGVAFLQTWCLSGRPSNKDKLLKAI